MCPLFIASKSVKYDTHTHNTHDSEPFSKNISEQKHTAAGQFHTVNIINIHRKYNNRMYVDLVMLKWLSSIHGQHRRTAHKLIITKASCVRIIVLNM